jgi:23S rRNA pseudouridine1911/1915/1917 synthase
LAHLGYPIVGDPVYLKRVPGSAKALPAPARDALLAFPRQALHAESLGFPHPITGESLRFTAPLPQDFKDLLALLNGNGG